MRCAVKYIMIDCNHPNVLFDILGNNDYELYEFPVIFAKTGLNTNYNITMVQSSVSYFPLA